MQATMTPPQSFAPPSGLPAAAQQIQQRGRGQDSMLVHMTPNEVRGLDAIARAHGGSLTINPQTGLPEAGFLSSILPMIAGAALAPFTGGASMAALLVGGGTALMTGSLTKGLMAGLGAFGGAGLGAGLMSAGATAPLETGTALGLAESGTAATQALSQAGAIESANAANAAAQAAQQSVLESTGSQVAADNAFRQTYMNQVGQVAQPVAPQNAFDKFQQMGRGLKNIFSTGSEGEQARQAFLGTAADEKKGIEKTGVGGIPGLIQTGATTVGPMVASMMGPDESKDGGPSTQEYIRPFKYTAGPQMSQPGFQYRTGVAGEPTSEQRYFLPTYTPLGVYKPENAPTYGTYAAGGTVQKDIGSNVRKKISRFDEPYEFADFRKKRAMEEAAKQMFAAGGDVDPDYDAPVGQMTAFSDQYALGGLTAFSKGGSSLPPRYLKGGGDGMSDSIKANIDGKQEARLADGEFVIPADVVSHLGNGSSNAGAKRLHNMMDRIRQARTGRSKQAPEVKAERFMPA